MSHASRALLTVFICVTWLACGGGSLRDTSSELWLEAYAVDLPTVAVGMESRSELQVRNLGLGAVRLSVREGPEGFSLSGGVVVVPGGASAAIRLRFHPYRVGVHEGRLLLHAEGAKEGVELEVRGRAVDFPWEAEKRVELPPVAPGKVATKLVPVTNTTDLPLELAFEWEGGEGFEVEPARLWLGPGATDSIEVRFSSHGGESVGYLHGNCRGCPRDSIQVIGRTQVERLRWEPSVLDFGSVAAGREVTKQVVLTNQGEAGISLDEVVASPAGTFEVGARELQLAPGASAEVQVTFLPPSEMAARYGSLLLRSGDRTLASIPLVGFSGIPALEVDPTHLDFGRRPLGGAIGDGGGPGVAIVTVRNLHPTPPSPLHFEIRGPGRESFEVRPLDGSILSSGAPLRLAVGMEPRALGLQVAELVVALEGVSQVVSLHGWGAVPAPRCPGGVVTQVGEEVRLTGADGSGLKETTCTWRMGSRPPGSTRPLEEQVGCDATFRPDMVGIYQPRLEIVDAAGNEESCTAEIHAEPREGLWVEAHWDRRSDVDLHLLHMGEADPLDPASWGSRADCHFANCIPGAKGALRWPGGEGATPILHLDDRSETGPETLEISQPSLTHGYALGLHWYSANFRSRVEVTVHVYCSGAWVATKQITLQQAKDLMVAAVIEFADDSCAVKEVGFLHEGI